MQPVLSPAFLVIPSPVCFLAEGQGRLCMDMTRKNGE